MSLSVCLLKWHKGSVCANVCDQSDEVHDWFGLGLLELHSMCSVQFSSVQSLSHVQLFVTPWTVALQASLSITNSQSSLRLITLPKKKMDSVPQGKWGGVLGSQRWPDIHSTRHINSESVNKSILQQRHCPLTWVNTNLPRIHEAS